MTLPDSSARAGASDESGAFEVACDRREGWEAYCKAKRGARRTRVALGSLKVGKAILTWEAATGYLIPLPLGSCAFRFIVPLKLGTCTSPSQRRQFSSPALRLLRLQLSIYHIFSYPVSNLDPLLHSKQNGSSHVCSVWGLCRGALCDQVIIVRSICYCPSAVCSCPQRECERQPYCGC